MGRGLTAKTCPRIFDRFEQGKRKKGNEHSTGIGLTLCKEFTLLHQGVIVAQSTPGAGTRFAIRLPKKQKAQKILYESHREVKNINTHGKFRKNRTCQQRITVPIQQS
jgi:K+-sensing histidine kinase KdpD